MPLRDVHGHRRIVELLSRSIARGALPPSLIFAGPAGAGKRLTATAVAQTVNCLQPRLDSPDGLNTVPTAVTLGNSLQAVPIDACGTCTACLRIARGVHPDVI